MADVLERLTQRERQCLRLVHAHFSSKQIARELGIKPGTVDRHCENAVRKLKVESRIAAALALASQSRGSIADDPQYGSAPMAPARDSGLDRGAERTPHDPDRRYDTPRELARNGSHLLPTGHDRTEETNGSALDRRNAQTGAVHDVRRGDDGVGLHRSSDVGRQLLSIGDGTGRFGSILVVFGVAAAAAWILTALAGAEQFAFMLQHLRYGG